MDEDASRLRQLILSGGSSHFVISAWMMIRFRRRLTARPQISCGPMLPRDEQRQKNLSFIYNSNDTQCVNQLRMKRSPFYQLCDLFRSRGLLKDTFHYNIEEQVDMFLRVIGHNQRFRCIQVLFLRSCEILCRYFQKFLYAVDELRSELIVPPSTNVHPRIQNCRRWNPYFKVCTVPPMHNCPKLASRCLKLLILWP